jgi:small conductance mechanosensitive channel
MDWESVQTWLSTEGVAFLVNLLVFVVILIIGRIVIGMLKRVLRSAVRKSGNISDMLEKFLVDVSGKVMWVIVFMIALSQLGIDMAPMIASLGVAGFVIGFAFQESLGNLASGVMILINQPFKVGDFVEAGGHSGVVRELSLMSTMMTTGDNKRVTIPNGQVWGSSIVNYSAFDTRRVDMVVGIGYGDDIGKAIEVMRGVIDANDKVLRDPAVTIAVSEMADSSVNLVVRPWVNTADYWGVYFDLTRSFKEKLTEAGVEIPFPQMDVHHHGLPQDGSNA